jgi:5,6-dimethylbenzimidazole synthase
METQLDRSMRHPDFDPGFRDRLQALLAWRRDVRRFRRGPLSQGTLELG